MPQVDDRIDQMGQTKYNVNFVIRLLASPCCRRRQTYNSIWTVSVSSYTFSLCTAPATFTQIVEHVLQYFNDCVTAYIDDVIFYNKN